MKLSEYVTQVINDPKYGSDAEWVRLNLRREHLERIEAAHDAEVREHARHEFCDARLGCVVAEEPEWEYAFAASVGAGGIVYFDVAGEAEQRDPRVRPPLARRRKAGPWVEVTDA